MTHFGTCSGLIAETRLLGGPRVDTFVGPDKKPYTSLPKLLLCHYSDYFDRCFNGKFKEGQTQRLELPEDKVDDFEVLLEYMLHGTVGTLVVRKTCGQAIKRCMEVLEYADKYNLAETGDAVYDPLKAALTDIATPNHGFYAPPYHPYEITSSDAETVFRIAPPGTRLRELLVQGVISTRKSSALELRKWETEIAGYAEEMLRQLRRGLSTTLYSDPPTGTNIRYLNIWG